MRALEKEVAARYLDNKTDRLDRIKLFHAETVKTKCVCNCTWMLLYQFDIYYVHVFCIVGLVYEHDKNIDITSF